MTAAEQRNFFNENGYLVVEDILSPEALRELRGMVDQVLDGALKPEYPNLKGSLEDFSIQWEPAVKDDASIPRREKIRIVFHLCHTHSFFWRHATRPEILDVARNVLAPELKIYTDQMFVKPPRHGSAVPLHQDSGYWLAAEPNLINCWMALDDSMVENGCVRFIPGSHHKLLPHHHFDGPNSLGLFDEEVELEKEIPIEVKAGSAVFHHSLLIHRSLPNNSDRIRRGLVSIYLPADLRFYQPWNFHYGFKNLPP